MMKKFIPVLLIALFMAQAWMALAQEDEAWVEYTSEDGFLTVSHPDGWVSGIEEGAPGIILASNQEALDRVLEGEVAAESGDFAVGIILLPFDMLGMMGAEIPAEATQAELTTILTTTMMGQPASADPAATPDPDFDGPILEEAVEVELEDGETVTVIPVHEEDLSQAGFVVAWLNDNGVVVIGIAYAFDEEFDEEAQAGLLDIILTAEYTGTSDDVMAAMSIRAAE